MRLQKFFVLFIIIGLANAQVKWKIVSSNQNELIIHLESKIFSLEDLKPIDILIGLPSKTLPKLQIQAFNESITTLQKKIPFFKLNGYKTKKLMI